jgi:hypothetical protein
MTSPSLGRRITTTDMGPLFDDKPHDGDTETGMIYVVKSLSDDPEIRKLDGLLHKIGFTSGNGASCPLQLFEDDLY